MWKQRVATGLEFTTRSSVGRRIVRQATKRGYGPPNALTFMHIEPQFTVSVGKDLGTFRYQGTDADAVARHLFWTGLTRWELESWREFIPLAMTARCFVDVGAFTGCYSLVAATVNPSLTALAFEPVPSVYSCLARNLQLNGLEQRVTAVPAAVSDEVGTARFFIPDRPMPDTGFLESSARQSLEAGTWHEVRTTTLAAVLPGDCRIDLMKIDVEDAEGPVVASMADVLDEHRPTIFIEFLSTGTYVQAFKVLEALGYQLFHLTDRGRVPVAAPVPDDVFFNFLCVPRS